MPILKARAKRQQLFAHAVVIPDGWTPPFVEKTKEQVAFLKEVVKENKLMRLLSPTDQSRLVDAFGPVAWAAGVSVIKQGDAGDCFYIVESGAADVFITGGGLQWERNAQNSNFMSSGYSIDALTFKSLLMQKSEQDSTDTVGFLDKVKLLNQLTEVQKRELAYTAVEKEFKAGSNIICEGDAGKEFFIIKMGEVKCTRAGAEEEISRRLTTGDFFGELALMSSDTRQATVTATEDTICLCTSRPAFVRLLGPLSEIMTEMAAGDRK